LPSVSSDLRMHPCRICVWIVEAPPSCSFVQFVLPLARFHLPKEAAAGGKGDGHHSVRSRATYLEACFGTGDHLQLHCFSLPPFADRVDGEAGEAHQRVFQILSMSAENKRAVKTANSVLNTKLRLPAMVQHLEIWSQDSLCLSVSLFSFLFDFRHFLLHLDVKVRTRLTAQISCKG
jgi:hypothetical protein